MKKIKVLIFSPFPVFPLSVGGKVRIYAIASALSQLDCDVTVVSPCTIGQCGIKQINDNFRIHPIRYPFFIPYLFLDKPFPYQFLVSFHPGYRFFLKRYFGRFDIYQFEQSSFADLTSFLPREKIIYDAQNVEYDYIYSECSASPVRNLSTRRIFFLERKLLVNSARVFACSEEDKARFTELYGIREEKIFIVPNGIYDVLNSVSDFTSFSGRFSALARFKKKVVFTGSNVAHNRRAVRFILESLALELCDECAFILIGSCAERFKRNHPPNVFIDPDGTALMNYVSFSPVAINPMQDGSGTSMKILEYLAFGLPVISTDFGMRGYSDLRQFVTISRMDGFAEAIRKADIRRCHIPEALDRYRWKKIGLHVRGLYEEVVSRK